MSASPPLSERDVKALRDSCFGQVSSQEAWEQVRAHWCVEETVEWLRAHQAPLGPYRTGELLVRRPAHL